MIFLLLLWLPSVYIIVKRTGLLSIQAICIIFYGLTSIYGYISFTFFRSGISVPFDLSEGMFSNESIYRTAIVILVASICFSIPTIIFKTANNSNKRNEYITKRDLQPRFSVVFIFVFLTFVFYFISYGDGLFSRESYMPEGHLNKEFILLVSKLIGQFLVVISAILLGSIYKYNKVVVSACILLLFVFIAATASRFLIMLPIGILVGSSFFCTRKSKSIYLFASILLLLGILLPMQFRELQYHGFINYFDELIQNGLNYDVLVFSFDYITLYSFTLMLNVVHYGIIFELNELYVSISPLAGARAGWYDIADTLRFNKYAPFPALGELYSIGMLAMFLYYFLVGCLFYMMQQVKFHKVKLFNSMFFILTFLFGMLFIVMGLQYNLRLITRFCYYLLFFYLLIRFLEVVIINLKRAGR